MDKRWLSFELHKRKILTLILLLAFMLSLFSVEWNSNLIHSGGFKTAKQIAAAFFTPDLSGDILLLALESSWTTLSYAAAGMSLAIIIAFFYGILAAGIVVSEGKIKRYIRPFLEDSLAS
ncbi:hypothetical protein [Mesobacillus boroniphilus]|uniref:Phosphonate ABC transporter permease protein phnE2 n=1 Tax=Mesobacillus boroniphilus JCM 21738 TaxID=1294265 RepID=W4RKP7_9BACI|nr:hypothetical protein [Mesobacillus boroniphilus]GAE44722.1 phosphonate ABC transporter permease protein phnE2 [Mesobacillus boroniphilus JCM 21738]